MINTKLNRLNLAPAAALNEAAPRFEVRAMSQAVLDQVVAIERDIYEFPWTRGNFADSLSAGYDAWLFECDGQLRGYAVLMWALDEVHLLNLSVHRVNQGVGLGRAYLNWLMRNLTTRGAQRIVLEVRPSNRVARALYRAQGFTEIGVRRGYYPAARDGREDALVLGRTLSPVAELARCPLAGPGR